MEELYEITNTFEINNKVCKVTLLYEKETHKLVKETYFNEYDKIHRDNDLPAVIRYKNGYLFLVIYYRNGEIHRDDDLPAHIEYSQLNGETIPKIQTWFKKDLIHRDNDEPACIMYLDNKNILKIWYVNNVCVKSSFGFSAFN